MVELSFTKVETIGRTGLQDEKQRSTLHIQSVKMSILYSSSGSTEWDTWMSPEKWLEEKSPDYGWGLWHAVHPRSCM